jgi:hypothetical protein
MRASPVARACRSYSRTFGRLAVVILFYGYATNIWRNLQAVSQGGPGTRNGESIDIFSPGFLSSSFFRDNASKYVAPKTPRGKLFVCGWPLPALQEALFPEYKASESVSYLRNSTVSQEDLILFGMHGHCDGVGRKFRVKPDYIEEHFPGKSLYVNGEPFGNVVEDYPTYNHLYQVGRVDGKNNHTVRVFYTVIVLLEKFNATERNWVFDPSKRPKWNGQYHSIMYMSARCATHRQEAALALSEVVPIVFGSRCRVDTPNGSIFIQDPHKFKAFRQTRDTWWDNLNIYRNYKYCLSMENNNQVGYISEKLIMAFLGGCLPIYWGTREVFEIFHKDAFIYYNFDNPTETLNEIRYLESNETAYRERLAAPILRNGSQTIDDFFSLSDDIGSGSLKRKIRKMLDLPDLGG